MPSISYRTTVRKIHEGFTFIIDARHILHAGTPSENVHNLKNWISGIEVVQQGNLSFSFSGTQDGRIISGIELQDSAIVQHTWNYLKLNMPHLGLVNVSDLYLERYDGRSEVSVSFSGPAHSNYPSSCLHLDRIDLSFVIRSTSKKDGDPGIPARLDAFSTKGYLPLVTALDCALEKFASLHLVRRYPLIFGLWKNKLHLESDYFSPISLAVTRVLSRSDNINRRRQYAHILKLLNKRHSSLANLESTNVQRHMTCPTEIRTSTSYIPSEELIGSTMFRLLKNRIRPPKYKILKTLQYTKAIEADFDFCANVRTDDQNDPNPVPMFDEVRWAEALRSAQDMESEHFPSQTTAEDDLFRDFMNEPHPQNESMLLCSPCDTSFVYLAGDFHQNSNGPLRYDSSNEKNSVLYPDMDITVPSARPCSLLSTTGLTQQAFTTTQDMSPIDSLQPLSQSPASSFIGPSVSSESPTISCTLEDSSEFYSMDDSNGLAQPQCYAGLDLDFDYDMTPFADCSPLVVSSCLHYGALQQEPEQNYASLVEDHEELLLEVDSPSPCHPCCVETLEHKESFSQETNTGQCDIYHELMS